MNSVKDKVRAYIERSGEEVFIRSEFERFGGYGQVGKALLKLVEEGFLVRCGYGILVRGEVSKISGNIIPRLTPMEYGWMALEKLGIRPRHSSAALAYNERRTTSIPVWAKINVGNSRITRKIGFQGRATVKYERGPNDEWCGIEGRQRKKSAAANGRRLTSSRNNGNTRHNRSPGSKRRFNQRRSRSWS
jgi:hypothetical protein